MRAPVSWIRDYVDLPDGLATEELAQALTDLGLKLEALEKPGADMQGPLVIGRVLTMNPEPQKNGKTINWCTVDVGEALNAEHGSVETDGFVGIVCGAHNFEPGDLVVTVLPGGVLPGDFHISARKTYGHISTGMICSSLELGLGEDHDGIIVLPADAGEPGDDAFDTLPIRDEVIEFEINPDRAYALSLRGVAREAAMEYDAPFRDPCARDTPPANGEGHPISIDDPVGCPVFVARTVSGFDPTAPSPDWMQRRLQLAGMRPISLAVDVTNYVMLETGRPIHGYDADKVRGTVGVRRAHPGERLTTLDGANRELSDEDLVVTDDSGIIGLGGVMGGEDTEISESTTKILVEAAHWDPVSMFRTGRRHKITSEAGKRNERGVDPTICEAAADRVVELLTTHGGGTADPGVTVVGTSPRATSIEMPLDLPARITGIDIDSSTTVNNLERVGCAVTVEGDRLTAVVPPWRPDLSDPYDLVEEVARVVGYGQVPSVLPPAPAGRGLTRPQRLRRRIGRTMAGAGWVEVVSFPFVGDKDLDQLGLPGDDPRRNLLRLANPLSAEQPLMTATLLPGLLRAAARNAGRGTADVALFETATITLPGHGEGATILPVDRAPSEVELKDLFAAVPDQPLHLAAVASGDWVEPNWWGAGRPVSWSDAVDAMQQVAAAVGLIVQPRSVTRAPWHPGRCAALVVGDPSDDAAEIVVGHAGELHPRVCAAYGVAERSVAAEIDLDLLLRLAPEHTRAPSYSNAPVAKEDVALVVDVSVPVAQVEAALREGAGELLESIRLFDVYTGEQAGEGRKSLAFALRFRAPDRTLKEGEAGAARDAAVAEAVRRVGAVQR